MKLTPWNPRWDEDDSPRLVTTKVKKLDVPQERRNTGYNWGMAEVRPIANFSTMESVASLGASLVPYAKYLLPHEQEAWTQMDGYEKAESLAWETFGAATIIGGGLIMKYGGKGLNKLQQFLKNRSLLSVKPFEESVEQLKTAGGIWRKFDYQLKVEEILQGRKFAKEESKLIGQVLSGADPVVLKAHAWENADKLSKAWKKNIVGSNTPYGGPRLSEELAQSLTPEKVRNIHYRKLYLDNLRSTRTGVNKTHVEEIAKFQMGRVFGDDVAKDFSLGNATDELMSNLLRSIFEPEGSKAITAAHRLAVGAYRLPWIHPERELYGMGEALFGTKTKIYDKIKESLDASNVYRTDKLTTLLGMLDERGFGEITAKGFKANKEIFTRENLDDAYRVLQRIDNLAESGRKGSLVSGATKKQIDELVMETKERAPIVAQLVEVSRDYTDQLYKDFASKFPLGLFNKTAEITPEGRVAVEAIADKWNQVLDQIFSSSGANSFERVRQVRRMLKDYRNLLDDPEKLLTLRGKKLTEKVDELKGRLTYNGQAQGAFPAYLEGYLPRVAQRGLSYENTWHTALTGKPSASFMKHRIQKESGPLVNSLQDVLEARTSAQAKQLFFYDEMNEMVKSARRLPDDWKQHVDFTLGRVLGRPTEWDNKLATLIERVSGRSMDSYRAMNAARTVTGAAYTGMLGLRPFAALRNLTQPILMVPAEMGGTIRDSVSMIAGLGKAITKEHRDYIKSLGAIAEFLPDQEVGQVLPRVGIKETYNSLKDAMMYMFRMSDRFNRYWTGGAAIDKWDNVVKNVGTDNLRKFSKAVGLNARQPWVRKEIERFLEAGNVKQAKAHFVKDVIANSQYLYGALDMPPAMGSGGAQKLVTTFNSWWMNYASATSRWMMTGDADDRAKRMITFLMTSAMAEQALEMWAGPGPARRSMFFGPLPLGDLGMPPAIKPIWHALAASKDFAQGVTFADAESRQKAYQEFSKSIRSASYFVPGGLAFHQWQKRGIVGGLGQYRPEEYEPLWGWLKR